MLEDWNARINLVSRKDIDALYEKHFLHSLAIARFICFNPGTRVMDAGTGGGFPGIPLAIYFPEVEFLLVDSIGKKVRASADMIQGLGLQNAMAWQGRIENHPAKFDFIVSRAVTRLKVFLQWTWDKINSVQKSEKRNGIICLKGGDITDELNEIKRESIVVGLNDLIGEPYFDTKKLVYIPKGKVS